MLAVVLGYDVPTLVKVFLILVLLTFLVILVRREYKKEIVLKYDYVLMEWCVGEPNSGDIRFDVISKAYINDWFIWVIFSAHGKHSKGIIIGRDSLPIERFMQLRRYILSPEVMSLNQI